MISKTFGLGLVLLSILNSCLPTNSSSASTTSTTDRPNSSTVTTSINTNRPSTLNVTISSNYTLYYDYYAYVFSGVDYDAYWPELRISNTSNSAATITFRYSFYVCGYRQTASGLNKTIYYSAPRGTSYWEMNEDDALVIPSSNRCNGALITSANVDFDWTVLSVY